ncbi:MAG: ribonuclease D [Bacteroidales bacterium]|nr:ribonuclease D [Bacteroidales bacterium]
MRRRRPFQPEPLPELHVVNAAQLADCLDHLRSCSVLGFDTEFVGEDTYRPDLCLLQVATAERLYLIDPIRCQTLDDFWELLLDPNRLTIVHAGREEIRMCWFATGMAPANLVDVQVASALVGLQYSIGYASLVQEFLGIRMLKAETLTDWRRRPLTTAQMQYAFDDVRYLLPIWERLCGKLTQRQRLSWAQEEFAAAIRRAVADDPTIERWRKLKGTGGLHPQELAVLRALYAWREEVAERQNRPARTVLRDDLIVEIARRSTGKNPDFSTLRGLPRKEITTISAVIQAALQLPSDQWPAAVDREADSPHVGVLATLLGVLLADYAAREEIAPAALATVSDLKALVRSRQPGGRLPADSPFFQGWRAETVLPHLEAVLDGRVSIRVQDVASAAPLKIELPESEQPSRFGSK